MAIIKHELSGFQRSIAVTVMKWLLVSSVVALVGASEAER